MTREAGKSRRQRPSWSDLVPGLQQALCEFEMDLAGAQRALDGQSDQRLADDRVWSIVNAVCRRIEPALRSDFVGRLPTEYAFAAVSTLWEMGNLDATHLILPVAEFGTRVFSSRVNTDGVTSPEPITRRAWVADWSEAVVCDVWSDLSELDAGDTRTLGQSITTMDSHLVAVG